MFFYMKCQICVTIPPLQLTYTKAYIQLPWACGMCGGWRDICPTRSPFHTASTAERGLAKLCPCIPQTAESLVCLLKDYIRWPPSVTSPPPRVTCVCLSLWVFFTLPVTIIKQVKECTNKGQAYTGSNTWQREKQTWIRMGVCLAYRVLYLWIYESDQGIVCVS